MTIEELTAQIEALKASQPAPAVAPVAAPPTAAAPAAPPAIDYTAMGVAIAQAMAAAKAPEPVRPAPAAAPSAPAGNGLPTSMGVIDLFNCTPAQLGSLGAHGVREELEKLWKIGAQMNGAPKRPTPGKR